MPLVTVNGFAPVPPQDFATLDALPEADGALDLPGDADAFGIQPFFGRLSLIRISFPSSHDGRGFSLAHRLRDLGFTGTLRAEGNLISDQFRYALECGFDEAEISDELAARQPEEYWRDDKPLTRTYRDKLSGRRTNPDFLKVG